MKRDRYERLRRTAARLYLAGRWGQLPLAGEHHCCGIYNYHKADDEILRKNKDDIKRIRIPTAREMRHLIGGDNEELRRRCWILETKHRVDYKYLMTRYVLYFDDQAQLLQNQINCGPIDPQQWKAADTFGGRVEVLNNKRLHFLEYDGGCQILEAWERKCVERAKEYRQQFQDEIHDWQKNQIEPMAESFGMKRGEIRTKYWHVYARWCRQIDAGQWNAVKHEIPLVAKYRGMAKQPHGTQSDSARQLRALGFVA